MVNIFYKLYALKSIADDYSRVIIAFLMERPRSVIDIVVGYKIPLSTVYRRVRELVESRLITIHGSIVTEDGKKYDLYKSNIKAVRVIFGINSLDIEIMPNKDMEKSAYW